MSTRTTATTITRLRSSPSALLIALGLSLGVVLVGSIATSLWASHRVDWNGGCGDDGFEYCRMASGQVVPHPWSRRFLLPWTFHVLGLGRDGVVAAFSIADVLSLGLTAVLTAVLTVRIARVLGAERSRARAAAALSAVTTCLFPFAFHWSLFYPVLIDDVSLALAISWFVLATSADRRWQLAAVVPAALAVLTRESWLVAIAAACVARMTVDRRRKTVEVGAATLLVLGLCGALILTRPGLPNPHTDHVVAYATAHLRRWFTSIYGLEELGWMMFFSLGLVPLLLLRKSGGLVTLWRAGPQSQALVAQLLALVAVVVADGIALGSDVHRYVFAAAPFLTAFTLATVARHPKLDLELAACLAGSLAVWSPFTRLDGSREGYLHFFSPQYVGGVPERLRADLRSAAPALVVWVIVGVAATVLATRRRHP